MTTDEWIIEAMAVTKRFPGDNSKEKGDGGYKAISRRQ
jgi:hypothetical protein